MLSVSQEDKITKHACDKKFRALEACIRQAVSFLVDWPSSLFFLCLISFDTMLDLKPQTQLSQQDSQRGAQKSPVRNGGDFMLLDSSISSPRWQMFRIIFAIKRQSTI